MNRLRYECYKGIGKPRKINKGVKAWHHDYKTCAVCGANADEPWHEFCPKCGTRYLDNPYTQKRVEPYQMEIADYLSSRGNVPSELEKDSQKLEKNFGELDCISRAGVIKILGKIEQMVWDGEGFDYEESRAIFGLYPTN